MLRQDGILAQRASGLLAVFAEQVNSLPLQKAIGTFSVNLPDLRRFAKHGAMIIRAEPEI